VEAAFKELKGALCTAPVLAYPKPGEEFTLDTDASNSELVRFEVFTAVTIKNGVFWDVTSCGSFKNRRFGVT
jgi:hypothetical protein